MQETLKDLTSGVVCEMNQEKLPLLARYEVALKHIYKELGADCMAVCCWEMLQTRYGIAGCSTFARLNDQGYLTACEVDVLGALSMLAASAAGLEQTPPILSTGRISIPRRKTAGWPGTAETPPPANAPAAVSKSCG